MEWPGDRFTLTAIPRAIAPLLSFRRKNVTPYSIQGRNPIIETRNGFCDYINSQLLDYGFRRSDVSVISHVIALPQTCFKIALCAANMLKG